MCCHNMQHLSLLLAAGVQGLVPERGCSKKICLADDDTPLLRDWCCWVRQWSRRQCRAGGPRPVAVQAAAAALPWCQQLSAAPLGTPAVRRINRSIDQQHIASKVGTWRGGVAPSHDASHGGVHGGVVVPLVVMCAGLLLAVKQTRQSSVEPWNLLGLLVCWLAQLTASYQGFRRRLMPLLLTLPLLCWPSSSGLSNGKADDFRYVPAGR